MSKPDDIPQDAWDKGMSEARFYADWLHAGNSSGQVSEHAVSALADSFARAVLAAKAEEREACESKARLPAVRLLEWASDDNNPLYDYDNVPERIIADAIAVAKEALALRTPSDGVKPMKWGATSYGKPEAITVAGTYRITDAWDGGFNVNRGNVSFQSEDGRRNFSTIEAAKAAAQADYEQRILSALTGKE